MSKIKIMKLRTPRHQPNSAVHENFNRQALIPRSES